MGEELYCNYAAGSFHTKNFVPDFIRLKLKFYFRKQKSLFEPPFGGLRGNIRTPAIARWKARGRRPPIRHSWTFPLSLTVRRWDVISGNLSKSALFEGGWVTLSADFRRKGHRPPTTVGVRKLE